MTIGVGFRYWIAAVLFGGLTASAAVAQDAPNLAATVKEAIVARVEQRVLQLALAQEEGGGGEVEAQAPPPRGPSSIVRFGDDYTVEADERLEELVVFGGAVTIRGEVERDLAVIGGPLEITETGGVGGDFVVIGGNVTIRPGARVDGDMVVVGGVVDSPAGFVPGGDQVVAGSIFGGADFLAAAVPWVSRGLFWGRLIVPDLLWIWTVVGILLALYLGLNLVFDGPVRACVQTLGRKPLTTFLVGLLVLLLVGPTSFILMVSVIGLAIIPFLWAALAVAGLLGSVAVSRWIGEKVVRPRGPAGRGEAAGAVLVGFAIIVLAFMIPVIGLVASASLGVFAVGAASISVLDGLRRENPDLGNPPPPGPESGSKETHEGIPEAQPIPSEPESAASVPPESNAAAGPTDLTLLPCATFLIRAGAFVLDVLLVALLNGILVFSNGGAFFVLLLAYHIAFWSWKGTTVGGIICRLRVVRTDGQLLLFTDAFVRGLSSIFSAVVLGLGWFWILTDPERQSWHDKIAGTYVVTVPRSHPLP
jgi:uncharacterized RDD family membrane protein YckC